MGAVQSIQKVNYEDIQRAIKNNTIIINTLSSYQQNCLITNTINCDQEVTIINRFMKTNQEIQIIVYGKNNLDESAYKKYEQLQSLGLCNSHLYVGGLFEWLLLQDIYGDDEFPTTQKELDILKYKPITSHYI